MLFGSYARVEETVDSDVDILVEFGRSSPIGLFTCARVLRKSQECFGHDVDLVV